ncbi:MAG: hypothetical protein ACKOFA_00530 [Rhodoluna sp.]
MVSIAVGPKSLSISLSARERSLLGRPNLALELNRVKAFQITEMPGAGELGVRVSKRPLLGGLTGEWRLGSSRMVVLGGKAGAKALKLTLLHPTIDVIWYSGTDVESLFAQLGK